MAVHRIAGSAQGYMRRALVAKARSTLPRPSALKENPHPDQQQHHEDDGAESRTRESLPEPLTVGQKGFRGFRSREAGTAVVGHAVPLSWAFTRLISRSHSTAGRCG